jgi:hypothetical protein
VVFFPLDQQLQLQDKHWSEGVVKETVWLSGVVDSYAEVAEVLRRVGRVQMSTTSAWRRVEKWGGACQALEAEQAAKAASLPMQAAAPVGASTPPRLGAAMDGAMVTIRNEGWKELKAGCVFAIEPQTVLDPETHEPGEQAQATALTYVAHLGGPDELGQRLWAQAQARGWEQATDTQVLGDGAAWIWQLSDLSFAPRQQTVDWYHATEHLHAAAHLYAPHNERAASRWYNAAETLLFQGQVESIVHQLTHRATLCPAQAEGLLAQATYFDHQKRRMQYLELREEGYLLGSGMIESAVKQFKARFTGPGMRWSREGISRLIPIRAAVLSHTFDALWPSIYSFSKN